MTPKQLLDSSSESLMHDERILSARERDLLSSLVAHTRSASIDKPETLAAVRATIASAIGETIAQRAFSVIGGSVVERLVGSANLPSAGSGTQDQATVRAGSSPTWLFQPFDPFKEAPPEPPSGPQPPNGPKSPSYSRGRSSQPIATTSVLDRPRVAIAQCVVLDEFLAPQELQELTRFTLEHEAEFDTSHTLAPGSEEGIVNKTHRRSRVLMDLGRHQDLILSKIQSALPLVLSRLGEEFSIDSVEAQITASNDGDFFHYHSDNGDPRVASRRLTFVYFFHREPRPFNGGELRLYDSPGEGRRGYQTIVPQQNQIVFFDCSLMHEITPVECPSKLFADSRFTLNGWLHR